MTKDEFKERQERLGLTNAALAVEIKYSEQSVSNWRNGVQEIPPHVDVLLTHLESQGRSA